jgi:hypothetical protein
MDRHVADMGGGGERKKRERVGKNISNYVSANSKFKDLYGGGQNDDDPFKD